ncbi:Smr/MutS family protein [Candidatus Kirkpatrickella diaphorinae]|uniref:Smr/MutS family protein n=1 Tax=Candidatus Kirkpatrickella diaphorinae TaxID=2984322 RepID=A0ABY6GKR0_9PROT|nr:Smr/MutS family protein [Candidatus Kirkpatrickella diaphorinae]UYH52129.1 Smr/MutS family protein [Candidatus Kirkpatrickella diaphorinae]
MRRRELAPDERTLWDMFTRDIAPLKSLSRKPRKKPVVPAPQPESALPTNMRAPSRQRLKATPGQDRSPRRVTAPTPKIEIGARLPGLDNTSWRALLKGKKAAQRKLDLHGFAAQKAFHALHDFLIQSHRDEVRYVEVITGLGGGGEGGVLRRELPHWLERQELRPLILGVVYTHRANKGAVRILLRAGRRGRTSP